MAPTAALISRLGSNSWSRPRVRRSILRLAWICATTARCVGLWGLMLAVTVAPVAAFAEEERPEARYGRKGVLELDGRVSFDAFNWEEGSSWGLTLSPQIYGFAIDDLQIGGGLTFMHGYRSGSGNFPALYTNYFGCNLSAAWMFWASDVVRPYAGADFVGAIRLSEGESSSAFDTIIYDVGPKLGLKLILGNHAAISLEGHFWLIKEGDFPYRLFTLGSSFSVWF